MKNQSLPPSQHLKMSTDVEPDVLRQVAKVRCQDEGLFFARYFFKQRTGGKMIVAPHHKVISKRLIVWWLVRLHA
jgi:hypothetical protein